MKKNVKKKKKGFTLIELIAVIIILGILMVIAVPAVTKYINDSRKDSYVKTAKIIANGVRNLVHSGDQDMNDIDTTYYINGSCIKTEKGYKSPYGEFEKAYVAVTADEEGHEYYWTSVDETGTGVKNLTNVDDLDRDNIESNITSSDIITTVGIGKRSKIVTIDGENCTRSDSVEAAKTMNLVSGRVKDVCPASYTPTIYWALQDKNSDGKYDKLIISDSEVSGELSGNFPGDTVFTDANGAPWVGDKSLYNSTNLSYYVSEIEIVGKVVPKSTAYWFYAVGYDSPTINVNLNNLEMCRSESMYAMFCGFGANATSFYIDIRDWDTSNVKSMSYAFFENGAASTTWKIDGLEYLDTSNVLDMKDMFHFASMSVPNLNLNLSKWNTSKVKQMENLFSDFGFYSESFYLDLSNWDTSNVTNMSSMFNTSGFQSNSYILKVNNWDTSNVTDMSYMFRATGKIATIWNIEGLKKFNTSNATTMSDMFSFTAEKADNINLDLSKWNTTNVENMEWMFQRFGYEAKSLNLDIRNFNTSNVTNMTKMFYNTGAKAQTYSVIIPRTNGDSVNNTTSKIYGQTSSVYCAAPSSKPFTLAPINQ